MQCVRNVSSLNHLRHVGSVLSCAAHVNGKGAIQSSDTLMIQEVKRVAARSTRGGNFSSVGLREETLPEQKSRWLGNPAADVLRVPRSEEHTSELQSRLHLVCRLLLEKKNNMLRSTLCAKPLESADDVSRLYHAGARIAPPCLIRLRAVASARLSCVSARPASLVLRVL